MAWTTIVEARSLDEFTRAQSGSQGVQIPHNKRARLEIQTYVPIAPIANMVGAEWFAARILGIGGKVIDVHSEGWNKVVVEFWSDPIPVVALIGVIAAALGAASLLIMSIKLSADGLERAAGSVAFGLGAVLVLAVGAIYLLRGRDAPAR